MKRVKVRAVSAIAASCVVGLGLTVTLAAHAGTTGARLRVCAGDQDYRVLTAQGWSVQEDEYRKVVMAFGAGCTEIPDIRWENYVSIKLSDSASGKDSVGAACWAQAEGVPDQLTECQIDLTPYALTLTNAPAKDSDGEPMNVVSVRIKAAEAYIGNDDDLGCYSIKPGQAPVKTGRFVLSDAAVNSWLYEGENCTSRIPNSYGVAVGSITGTEYVLNLDSDRE